MFEAVLVYAYYKKLAQAMLCISMVVKVDYIFNAGFTYIKYACSYQAPSVPDFHDPAIKCIVGGINEYAIQCFVYFKPYSFSVFLKQSFNFFVDSERVAMC